MPTPWCLAHCRAAPRAWHEPPHVTPGAGAWASAADAPHLPNPAAACCPSFSPRFSVAATTACSSHTGASRSRSTRSRRSSSNSTTRRCRPRRTSSASASPRVKRSTRLLPEAFAVVREGCKRTLKMRHFDVQLIGGMALHNGKIAEMRTGEGKTLTATLPVYLNALTGKGVHVVTVNDYLAHRDAEWMGRLYTFLGLTVGVNLPQMSRAEKQAAYAADVTYGTNNEFGFDYLRDNMVQDIADRVARGLYVRHRRRGRLDPDRRGAHAADHQRPGRRPHRSVRAHQRRGAAAEEADRRARPAHRRGRDRAGRLHGRREEPPGLPDRGRARERRAHPRRGRAAGRRREPVRPGQHHADAPCVRGAARQAPVPPRPALRGAERRGRHRRRVHRPPDDGPALERRPAPGRRGQGGRADPEREPDARLDHLPELLPHVRQARRA